jgi:hypothetical protein
VLFFRIPEIRKTHFSEKGPQSEKTRPFTLSYGFSSKERSAGFCPPRMSRKSLQKVSKSDPETNSEKNVTSFLSWVEKARKNGSSDAPGGSLSGPPAPPRPHLTTSHHVSCLTFLRISMFCSFHKFLHVFSASRNSRQTYWHLADRRCSSSDPEKIGTPVFNVFLRVSSDNRKCKKHRKTQIFKTPVDILLLGCLLGAPGCSFSGSLKFEKRTFPKKGPDLKKYGISLLWF